VDGVRYFRIKEEDVLDERPIAEWISQAAKLPGAKF
jgi:hypothetical protein